MLTSWALPQTQKSQTPIQFSAVQCFRDGLAESQCCKVQGTGCRLQGRERRGAGPAKPQAQYEATNKIRTGFVVKADTQQFIAHVLLGLKELGYSFKTQGPKDEFWDADNDTASVSSRSSTRLWSSIGSKKPNKGDQVVFVDMPEYLPPKQL